MADNRPVGGGEGALVRQTRPIGGSYCILSVYDCGNKGAKVMAYDSEMLIEKELPVSWEDIHARLGNQGSADSSAEEKRGIFTKLLTHVTFDAGQSGTHSLTLTTAARQQGGEQPFETVEGILFDRPGGERSVSPGSPDSHGPRPAMSPIVNGRTRSADGSRKPRTAGGSRGLSPNKSLPRLSQSRSSSRGSLSRSGEIAGYKPPSDLSQLDEELLGKARRIVGSDEEIAGLCRDTAFVLAAKRVGVTIDELQPRTIMSFREGPTPMAKLKLMHEHYDHRRVLSVALVLMELDSASEHIAELNATKSRQVNTFKEGFNRTLQLEKSRLSQISEDRRKIERVAEAENELLLKRRQEFEEHRRDMMHRDQKLHDMRDQQKAFLQQRSAERSKEILRVQQQKEQREADRVEAIRIAAEERARAIEKHREEQAMASAGKDQILAEKEEARRKKREEVEQARKVRRAMLLEQLAEKASASATIKQKRVEEVESKRAERWLLSQSRAENAERVRREKEFRQKQVMERIETAYTMMDHMKELREAIVEERKKTQREMIIRVDQWKSTTKLERSVSPGPGEYQTHAALPPPAGGTWGKYAPKSDLEWIIYRASQLPGPGQYKDVDLNAMVTGGTWGKYRPKSDVEWQIYRASQLPGPGEYEPRSLASGASTRFGSFNPKSQLDLLMDRARELPGPTDYAPRLPSYERPSLTKVQEKLQRAAKKLTIATHFIAATSKAAKERRRSMVSGAGAPPLSVDPLAVNQMAGMLRTMEEAHLAEEAAMRGDAQSAAHHADAAVVEAASVNRKTFQTGTNAGIVAPGSSQLAAKTASAMAQRARRASLVAAEEARERRASLIAEGGEDPSLAASQGRRSSVKAEPVAAN